MSDPLGRPPEHEPAGITTEERELVIIPGETYTRYRAACSCGSTFSSSTEAEAIARRAHHIDTLRAVGVLRRFFAQRGRDFDELNRSGELASIVAVVLAEIIEAAHLAA